MSVFSILEGISAEQSLTSDSFPRLLCAAKAVQVKPAATPLKLPDGGGLQLYVSPSGAKSWRYRFRLAGKEQTLTIGSPPEISLAEARSAHRAARWLVERGINPMDYVRQETERAAAATKARAMGAFASVWVSFDSCTRSTLAPRTVKHREAMVAKYLIPMLGDRLVSEITRKELAELLAGIDQKAPETARACRIYIKQIFDYALDQELVPGNPTPPTKVLVNQRARRTQPRKALPLNRLGEFIKTLKDAESTDPQTKAAMQLLILTWCRTSEVVGARWEEFDLEQGIWSIPAERMKGGEPHTVYLSRQALAVLESLPKGTHLFPNRRRPEDHMARTSLYQWRLRHGFADVMDVHGFRAVASTWANEQGRYRADVIEAALAHKEPNKVRAAYNRAGYVAELRQLWQDWADLCDEKEAISQADNVVSLAA